MESNHSFRLLSFSPEDFLKELFEQPRGRRGPRAAAAVIDAASRRQTSSAEVELRNLLRSQHTFCPICQSMPRVKVVRLEEARPAESESRFWKAVSPRTSKAALVHYAEDFAAFGFDVNAYFRRLRVKSKI